MSSADAAIFHLNASYDDGTNLTLAYDDDDGVCALCTVLSGSVVLGTDLQAAVDANPNPLTIVLANVTSVDNSAKSLSVTNRVLPIFAFALQAIDPEIFPINFRDTVQSHEFSVAVIDLHCVTVDPGSGDCVEVNPGGFGDPSQASASPTSVTIVPLPSPLILLLFGASQIGIWGRGRKSTDI